MSVEGTVCKLVGTRATSKKIFGFLIIPVAAAFQSLFTTFFQSGFYNSKDTVLSLKILKYSQNYTEDP